MGDYRVQSLNLGRRSSVGSFLRKALASFFAGLSSLALDFPIASVAARNDSDDSSAPWLRAAGRFFEGGAAFSHGSIRDIFVLLFGKAAF